MKSILYTLGLLGTLGTWGRAAVDGTLVHLFHALHGPKGYILPGTASHLRKNFTGIYWPIDYLLNVLIVFFWEAVDGSHPGTSAIGIYFLAQLFPILVAFYTDYSRQSQGLGSRLLRPTLWLLAFQSCALGCTGFVWALAYTTSSPTTARSLSSAALQNASRVSPQKTLLILPALGFGYILPAILMALPSPRIVSNNFQQLALVSWNLFPLLVFVHLKFLGAVVPIFSGRRNDRPASSPQEHLRVVTLVSVAALVLSAAVHVGVIAVSIVTVVFPALFDAKYVEELSPASMFLPPVSISRSETVGDGVRGFFLWDQAFGYPVMILVMLLQLRTAAVSQGLSTSWAKLLGLAVLITCIAGPGSACLALSWLRDEMLFGSDREASAKHE